MSHHTVLAGITRAPMRGIPAQDLSRMLRALNPPPHSPLGLQDRLQMEVVGPDGTIRQRTDIHGNILCTYGLNRLCELIATGGDASNWAQGARIGTDATAAASTQDTLGATTQSIALSGASMDVSDQGNLTARYVMTFASNGDSASIREIGLYASSNVTTGLIARRDLTGTQSVNRGASDEIRVSWDIVFTTA